MQYPEAENIKELVDKAQKIVVIQADNPDGDSLASALALEQILGDLDKQTFLYCGVNIPSYLTHMEGWDRVQNYMPSQFDLSIIVDTSADSLLETLNASQERQWVASKPCIVLDHHDVEATIPYATIIANHPAVATGELIYELAQQLSWPLNLTAKNRIAISIMADSLGLTSEATTARSIHVIAELVEGGVSIAALEHKRREMMRKSAEILSYKGRLLQRIEYYNDTNIAIISIPWEEIEQYSHAYNPSMLALDEMRMVEGVAVAIAFKTYPDGKITGKIRANYGKSIAGALAKHFGGGGHPYASGFKIQDNRPFSEVKSECIRYATELLNNLNEK